MFLTPKLLVLGFLTISWDPMQPAPVPHGFLTGNDYLQKSEPERHGYVMGLLDGIFLSPIAGGDAATIQRLKACTLPMNSFQIKAIFEKYLSDNPQGWHNDAQIIFWQAFLRACPDLVRP